MLFGLSRELKEFQEKVRQIASAEIEPHAAETDRSEQYPWHCGEPAARPGVSLIARGRGRREGEVVQAGIARIGLLAIALCLALSTPCVAAPTTMGLITSLRGNVLDPVKLTLARWVHRVRFNDETLYGLEDPRIKAVIASVPMAAPIDMGSMAHPHAAVG